MARCLDERSEESEGGVITHFGVTPANARLVRLPNRGFNLVCLLHIHPLSIAGHTRSACLLCACNGRHTPLLQNEGHACTTEGLHASIRHAWSAIILPKFARAEKARYTLT